MTRRQPLQEVIEKPIDNDHSKALRSLMGSVKQLDSEEQNKRKIQMKKIARQQGEEKLDTFLTEQLGLDF